ncbi:MAG: GNAT family N-acetyltransferase [Opitutaceae bacterium]
MGPALLIRPYRPSDLDGVIAIFVRAIREIAARDYNQAQVDAWARPDRNRWTQKRLDRPTWVAVVDQSLAGFTDLEASGHLDMMYVHPEFQRLGVATALLQSLEDTARSQGLSRIFTESSVTARPLLERRGFHVVTPQVAESGGQRFANFSMEKLLK